MRRAGVLQRLQDRVGERAGGIGVRRAGPAQAVDGVPALVRVAGVAVQDGDAPVLPRSSSGTNGAGGAVRKATMVDISSGMVGAQAA